MTENNQDYSASSISVLKGLEAVRKRPGMYIGDTSDGSGLHHMPQEIIDNAVDEAQAGFATQVEIRINKDNSVTVVDDGRGIPVDIHPQEGVSAAEIVMTKLHAGGKFNQNSYKVAGGLHGVGAAVVNALSEWMKVEIIRDGGKFFIEFHRGIPVAPLERIGDAEGHGTTVTYLADKKIFGDIVLDGNRICKRVQELACLNPGIRFLYTDSRPETVIHHDWTYNNGVSDLVKLYSQGEVTVFPEPIRFTGTQEIMVKDPTGDSYPGTAIVDVALNWLNGNTSSNIYAFTNNIFQKEGGTHVQGARIALSNAFRSLITKTASKKKLPDITVDDLSEGITLVVSIKIPEPSFSSQTKEKLTSSEAQRAVGAVTSEAIQEWIDRNPVASKVIVERVLEAAEARIAAREASKRSREKKQKNGLDIACMPGKLADCESSNPAECEIFIVEGDSAGGTAKSGRDARIQAILPLRGKILNTETLRPSQFSKNMEVGTLIKALGIGGLGPNFDISGLRYNKIVIMTDADVDGSHIQTLLLTFFYRHTPELLRNGHIYVAQPPLYAIKRGKEEKYVLNNKDFDNYLFNEVIEQGYALTWIGVDGNEVSISGDKLMTIINNIYNFNNLLSPLLRVQANPDLIENFICCDLASPDAFSSENIEETAHLFIDHMADQETSGKWSVGEIDYENGSFEAVSRKRGILRKTVINKEILESSLLQKLLMSEDYDVVGYFQKEVNARLVLNEHSYPIRNVSGFIDAISEIGRSRIDRISRFKGLGEMNDTQLWETTLDPANRSMLQVEINEEDETNIIFTELMGKDTQARKRRFLASMGISDASEDSDEDNILEDEGEDNEKLSVSETEE